MTVPNATQELAREDRQLVPLIQIETSTGTVTQVNTGTGLTGGPVTTVGTISLADTAVAASTYGGTTTVPNFTVDAQGRLTNAGNNTYSAAALSGNLPVTNLDSGTGAGPTTFWRGDGTWGTPSGIGTVTSVGTGTGLTGGPITGTGTISFAAVADQRLLANISGLSAAPSANSLSAILDAILGSTVGYVAYRDTGGWVAAPQGIGTYNSTISAAGTVQGDATALTALYNRISSCTAGQGVILTFGVVNIPAYIRNDGAAACKIYPNVGATINGGSANAAVTLSPGAATMLIPRSSTAWESFV